MCPPFLQVFDEYSDEVADAETAEASGPAREDRDQDVRPFMHKQKCVQGVLCGNGMGWEGGREPRMRRACSGGV